MLGYSVPEFVESLHRIAYRRFDVGRLVTGQVGLDEVADAFTILRKPTDHDKIMVEGWR